MCMFDFFDNRDKCRKTGFWRGNIYTLLAFLSFFFLSFRSFCKKRYSFQMIYLSLPLSLSHFPPFPHCLFISSFFLHFLSIFSFLSIFLQPGCQAATSCATLMTTRVPTMLITLCTFSLIFTLD